MQITHPITVEQKRGPLCKARDSRINDFQARNACVLLQLSLCDAEVTHTVRVEVVSPIEGDEWVAQAACRLYAIDGRRTRKVTTSSSSYLNFPFHPSSDRSPEKASFVRSPGRQDDVGPKAADMSRVERQRQGCVLLPLGDTYSPSLRPSWVGGCWLVGEIGPVGGWVVCTGGGGG
eukprot:COSAG02_NODE_10416_length_1946_cov_1.191121_2_plen_176_part_00